MRDTRSRKILVCALDLQACQVTSPDRRPQDVRLERQFGMSPGWSNTIFRGCPGNVGEERPWGVLGTNICWLGRFLSLMILFFLLLAQLQMHVLLLTYFYDIMLVFCYDFWVFSFEVSPSFVLIISFSLGASRFIFLTTFYIAIISFFVSSKVF